MLISLKVVLGLEGAHQLKGMLDQEVCLSPNVEGKKLVGD